LNTRHITQLAMLVAGLMMSHQVAAKAIRDAAFLTVLPATALPAMVIASAILSIAAVPLYTRLLGRFGPQYIVPAGFLLSSAGHTIEWSLSSATTPVAIAIYLHISALGALLLSGFWSLASEIFDPRTAKRSYGHIAGVGTLGGILGGFAAERAAVLLPRDSMLLLLAALHAICALGLLPLRGAVSHSTVPPQAFPLFNRSVLRSTPNVRELAALVALGTAGAAILDYLLKAGAAAHFNPGTDLLRFFAIFYACTQILTFLVQSGLAAWFITKQGLGRTVTSLPYGVGIASATGLLFPTLPVFIAARALESILRGSLFRSGYELLFTPMTPAHKRQMKTFLDVACDRAGDALGAGIVQVLLLAAPVFLVSELLGIVIAMAAISTLLGKRIDAIYRGAIERRLVEHAADVAVLMGPDTGWTMLQTIDLPESHPAVAAVQPASQDVARPPQPERLDVSTRLLLDLRSGERQRVEAALRSSLRMDTTHAAQLVRLLAWDDVSAEARQVLERIGSAHVGLLIDELLNENTDFAIRRRLPRILGNFPSQRTVDGLVAALDDPRFEVRYRCSKAIDRILKHAKGVTIDSARIISVVEREVSVARDVWEGHRVIDEAESAEESTFTDDRQHDRAHRSLEHVFLLLASVLPREPLKVAFQAIHSNDRILRGLALDYLESVLPETVRPKLWVMLESQPHAPRSVNPVEALERLLLSQHTLTPKLPETPTGSKRPPS
jgi:ATP:ADP antiporter, AAA family